jgi:CHASE2 domain-containing sensor protein
MNSGTDFPEPSVEPWHRYWLRALVFAVVIVGLLSVPEGLGWLHAPSATFLDSFIRWVQPGVSNDILVLEINQYDYKNYFRSGSPLKPCLVFELIESVRGAKPAVIGVDLDTSDGSWQEFSELQLNKKCPELTDREELTKDMQDMLGRSPGTPVVWAELPASTGEELGNKIEQDQTVELRPALGGKLSNWQSAGVALIPIDPDSVVRHYRNHYLTVPIGSVASEFFARVIADQFAQSGNSRAQKNLAANALSDRNWVLNYGGGPDAFVTLHMSDFLDGDPLKGPFTRRKLSTPLLSGKVVLIGGSYAEARDVYRTPLGDMAGVVLMAHALDSLCSRKPVGDLNPIISFILHVVAGLLISLIFFPPLRRRLHLSIGLATILALLLMFIGPTVISVFLFHTGTVWFDFIPVMAGMFLHQGVEQYLELRDSEVELRNLHRHLGEVEGGAGLLAQFVRSLPRREHARADAELQALLAECRRERDDLRQQLAEMESRVRRAEEQLKKAADSAHSHQLRELHKQLVNAEARADKAEEQARELTVSAYARETSELLEQLRDSKTEIARLQAELERQRRGASQS